MPEPPYPPALAELARLHGIQTAYRDVFGRRRAASEASLLGALHALGAPVGGEREIGEALDARRRALGSRLSPPVAIAWGARAARVDLRIPPGAGGGVSCRLAVEGRDPMEWSVPLAAGHLVGEEEGGGEHRPIRRLVLPEGLPFGYHQLELAVGGEVGRTTVVCSPPSAPSARRSAPGGGPPDPGGERAPQEWGGFLPVYALRSEQNWGVGDLTDLRALLEWIRSAGGGLAAVLPFFAAFEDEPSPYSPASRLFWNEIHVDVTRVPELDRCPEARDLLASPAVRSSLTALRGSGHVDYAGVTALKRRVLELLAHVVGGTRRDTFEAFAASDPLLDDYARFRAACERIGHPWSEWPERQRNGDLRASDGDENSYRYHRYAQWVVHEQLDSLADKGGSGPLYLDLPIGVHPAGFDVWRERACFVPDASAGAPPDSVFTKGQEWGFPPMHPDGLRETGYRYVAECLRRVLRYAGVLRIDHVMGMHRLYIVPAGLDASQGVYLRYPAEELYAVLLLEAHRAGSVILGEDLGTVPGYVRAAMDRRNVHRSYVVEYELAGGGKLHPPRARDVASLDTHDMPTFAAFWEGADIDDRFELGLIDEEGAAGEHEQRHETRNHLVALLRGEGLLALDEMPGPKEVLRGCLAYISGSEAPIVVVNLEDLWLETEPQNVPGTTGERPNWRRKARLSLEGMRASDDVAALLATVEQHRRARSGSHR